MLLFLKLFNKISEFDKEEKSYEKGLRELLFCQSPPEKLRNYILLLILLWKTKKGLFFFILL